MRNFQKQYGNKMSNNTADATAMRLFVLLAFMLLSCSGVFGQNKAVETIPVAIEVATPETAVAATAPEAQMELVIWLMGSKQIKSGEVNASGVVTPGKKQFINCGMTPNRILSRTFMKKAINYESTIA